MNEKLPKTVWMVVDKDGDWIGIGYDERDARRSADTDGDLVIRGAVTWEPPPPLGPLYE